MNYLYRLYRIHVKYNHGGQLPELVLVTQKFARFVSKAFCFSEDTSSPISSSSTAEAAEEKVLSSSFVPTWERYIDELKDDEQWMGLVAMRSGLKQQFYTLFPRIVESFKRHVRAIGNEGHIVSSGDAKHYFWFFMNPSSPTYKNLILELQKPADKGKYKYEDRDPTTGKRSYCGVPIPDDAPPRPNSQAVWCEGKWVF